MYVQYRTQCCWLDAYCNTHSIIALTFQTPKGYQSNRSFVTRTALRIPENCAHHGYSGSSFQNSLQTELDCCVCEQVLPAWVLEQGGWDSGVPESQPSWDFSHFWPNADGGDIANGRVTRCACWSIGYVLSPRCPCRCLLESMSSNVFSVVCFAVHFQQLQCASQVPCT